VIAAQLRVAHHRGHPDPDDRQSRKHLYYQTKIAEGKIPWEARRVNFRIILHSLFTLFGTFGCRRETARSVCICTGQCVSASFAAAGAFPAVHEQAMRRLIEVTGLVPVEFPTTRRVGASAPARAADVNAAFADPEIHGILAVVVGRTRSPSFPIWTPTWRSATPNPSWGPVTTRICITGCG